MPYAIMTILLAFLAFAPSLWVSSVMRRHGHDREDIPGTGAELAAHLIQRFELEGVSLEETTERNDHYDPTSATVRLSPSNFNGKSLTAIAVATHEVGHAIQFQRGQEISKLRQRYLPTAFAFKKAGIALITLLPLVAILLKAPSAIAGLIVLSMLLQLIGALAYLIILPEEWDASFQKALPILIEGEYISDEDTIAVNSILKAAAFTYFATSLAELVNIGRWFMILRR